MKFKMDGFKDLEKNLKKVQKRAKELEKGKEVTFNELFTERFMNNYTKFDSLDEFFDESPFEIKNDEDFINLEKEKLNDWVKSNTSFENWDEMQERAVQEYTLRTLGL